MATTANTGVQRIGPNSYYLYEGKAVVTFSNSTLIEDVDKGKLEKVSIPNNNPVEIMTWGKNNDLPQVMEDLVTANNIVPALIGTKRNILTGNGLMAYKVRYEPGQDGQLKKVQEEVEMPAEVQAWLDGEDWENGSNFWEYLEGAAGEFVKHSLIIPEFVRYMRDGQKIKSLEVKECKWMRAGKKVDGRVKTWYWSGHWAKKSRKDQEKEKKVVPLEVYTGETKKQGKFIVPTGDYLFNDGYYPIPSWRGSKDWIEMANFIAPFHKANLQNGYNIRWHCEIPHDYFLDYEEYNLCATDEEKVAVKNKAQEAEQKFMDDVNEFLAGIAQAGRAVWTKYEIDRALGKEYPGIKIKPLSYDMKDESLLKLFDRSLVASASSQGIPAALANIETKEGMNTSGTQVRNAYLIWLIINTSTPRKYMLKPLDLVKKVNGWPADVFYSIRDYELTALNTNDAGMQERKQPVGQ